MCIRDHGRHATYCADRVIAVSDALKGELMWKYNLPDWKCWVILNRVPVHKYYGWMDSGAVRSRYGIGPMDPTVLFCGRLSTQKGPDLLLEAMPHLLGHHRHAKCVFARDGDMRAGLQHRANQLGVIWHNVTGLKIDPTIDSIGWGLGTLFTNFEWARWMGRNGRVAAEQTFTWEQIAGSVVQCYQS
jgi:glycosyltransferase involved in cell wall biosynthesis